jgi:plasmid stability protein
MPSGWLNVPHCRQELNHSCMAACVRMVLAQHGRSVPEADLRQLLGTKLSGTAARNLTAVASLGFDVQLTPSNLTHLRDVLAAGLPPIVFLNTGSLNTGRWTAPTWQWWSASTIPGSISMIRSATAHPRRRLWRLSCKHGRPTDTSPPSCGRSRESGTRTLYRLSNFCQSRPDHDGIDVFFNRSRS